MVETIRLHGDEHAVVQCGTCGVWHTVPLVVYNNLRRHGGFHFCPVAGHQWGWRRGQEETDAIRLERDRLKQEIAYLEDDRAAAWRAEAEAKAAKKKAEAALKRTMNRAGAGVCTCCNRSFVALARHMKSRHPDVVPMKAALQPLGAA
jgi:hypothetical protein